MNNYTNNAIINQTTVFTGNVFAIQLEDVKGNFEGRNFSVNLGSVDLYMNKIIKQNAIGSDITENTTAFVQLLPIASNNTSNTTLSVYRLTFYMFLNTTLFKSPQLVKDNFKVGSSIITVGGSAVWLAERLKFIFQIPKVNFIDP